MSAHFNADQAAYCASGPAPVPNGTLVTAGQMNAPGWPEHKRSGRS